MTEELSEFFYHHLGVEEVKEGGLLRLLETVFTHPLLEKSAVIIFHHVSNDKTTEQCILS